MNPKRTFPINGGLQALASLAVYTSLFWTQSLGFAQTTLSGDHVIAGNLNVGTSGTAKDLIVHGSGLFSGTRVGIGVEPEATLQIKTSTSEPNGALLIQRGYSWSQDENYYLKMLSNSGGAVGILVNGYGQTMMTKLGIGSFARSNYYSSVNLPLSIYNPANALLADFQTDYSADNRALIRFKSKDSGLMYSGVKYVPWGKTQYGIFNAAGNSDNPILVINDSTSWNGYVGIGTGNPAEKLDVNGNVKIAGTITINSTGTFSSIVIGSAAGGMTINGKEVLVPNIDGNIGIGIESPEAKLAVYSDSSATPFLAKSNRLTGPTFALENANEDGTIAVDYLLGESLVANCSYIGVAESLLYDTTPFFWVNGNPGNIPTVLGGGGIFGDAPVLIGAVHDDGSGAELQVAGDFSVTGAIRMPRQGDILMGEFGEEE